MVNHLLKAKGRKALDWPAPSITLRTIVSTSCLKFWGDTDLII